MNGTSPPVVVAAYVFSSFGLILIVDSIRSFCRTERYVSPNGQFSIALNASYTDDFNLVQGAFYTGINPNQSVQDAVLSIMMQSSSESVFDRSFTCFTIAENFTDLSLYVCLPIPHTNCSISDSQSSRFRTTSLQPTISYTILLSCSRKLQFPPRSTPSPRFYQCSINNSAPLMTV